MLVCKFFLLSLICIKLKQELIFFICWFPHQFAYITHYLLVYLWLLAWLPYSCFSYLLANMDAGGSMRFGADNDSKITKGVIIHFISPCSDLYIDVCVFASIMNYDFLSDSIWVLNPNAWLQKRMKNWKESRQTKWFEVRCKHFSFRLYFYLLIHIVVVAYGLNLSFI